MKPEEYAKVKRICRVLKQNRTQVMQEGVTKLTSTKISDINKTSPFVTKGDILASRKDKKGRVLRKGESFRITDEMYVYTYTDPFGKRRYTYSKDLVKLREKEETVKTDQMDGIDSYVQVTLI